MHAAVKYKSSVNLRTPGFERKIVPCEFTDESVQLQVIQKQATVNLQMIYILQLRACIPAPFPVPVIYWVFWFFKRVSVTRESCNGYFFEKSSGIWKNRYFWFFKGCLGKFSKGPVTRPFRVTGTRLVFEKVTRRAPIGYPRKPLFLRAVGF
jgi:hypothetical protein